MPRLRVLAGPCPSTLQPITHIVNTYTPYPIVSDRFEGSVVVHIKGFSGENGEKGSTEGYFERKERKGVTWSIQVSERFLKPVSSDDVLFGNTFDKKLKLPWGSGAALKFMHYIDPTLEHALDSDQPWALSPLIVTMPYFTHSPRVNANANSNSSQSPSSGPSEEKTEPQTTKAQSLAVPNRLRNHSRTSTSSSTKSSKSTKSSPSRSGTPTSISSSGSVSEEGSRKPLEDDTNSLPGIDVLLSTPSKRKNYFATPERRRQVSFGPDDIITTDFCYGFLSFPGLTLDIPGGISFDLMKYWDGQPVRFLCCERKKSSIQGEEDGSAKGKSDGKGPGEAYWCVVFEVVDDPELGVEAGEVD